MVEIRNPNPPAVGDKVFWFDAYDNLSSGKIHEIQKAEDGDDVAVIRAGRAGGIQTGAKLWKCWQTKEQCLDAEQERIDRQIEEYKESITNTKDLVKFLMTHDVVSDVRDYEAEKAAIQRVEELLGITQNELTGQDDFSKAVNDIPTQTSGIERGVI